MYARHVQKLIATATSLRSRANQLRKRTSYSNAGLPFANASDEKFVPWKYEAWRAPPKEIRETKEARHRPKNRRGIDNVLKSADPLKIAHTIKNMLFKDDFGEAMEVVRRASSQLPEQCIVGWNHIIDWQMSKHRISDAVKTYNEMKKRMQPPDNYTFTILFRGFAASANQPQALEKALSIYHSMFLDSAPVKPNITHTNAALNVCARAGDMSALWGIVAKLPRKGIGAADNLTYTTVLHALRQDAVGGDVGRLTESEQQAVRRKATDNGRQLWEEVIARWRSGDIFIDEELVCSMGRLLLVGRTRQDLDDILSLIQQTMNIRRPIEELGTPSRDRQEPSLQGKPKLDRHESSLQNRPAMSDPVEDKMEEKPQHATRFEVVKPPPLNRHGNGGYVRPGPNAISLVMEAILNSSSPTLQWASYYWDIFTVENSIVPDGPCYHGYLRVLRALRASSDTVKLVQTMPTAELQSKTFRIAISTCARDKNNPHAFDNAGKLLDLMQDTIDEPDIEAISTMHTYLTTATVLPQTIRAKDTRHRILELTSGERETQYRHALGKRLMHALHRLGPYVKNIQSYLSYGSHVFESEDRIKAQSYYDAGPSQEELEKALKFFGRLHAAHHQLLTKLTVPPASRPHLKAERAFTASLMTRLRQRLAQMMARTSDDPQETTYVGARHLNLRRRFPDGVENRQHLVYLENSGETEETDRGFEKESPSEKFLSPRS